MESLAGALYMIRERNLESMKENAFYLFNEMIESEVMDNNELVSVESYKAIDGNKYTVVYKGDIECRLNSIYSPVNEAHYWAAQYEAATFGRTNRIFLLFGLSNGYFLRELINNLNKDESIIIYEPSKEVFFHVIDNYDITDILNNEQIFIAVEGINQNRISELLRYNEVNIMQGQSVIISIPDYDILFNEKLVWFMEVYNDIYLSAIMNRNTASFYGEKWAEAEIDNLKTILDSNLVEECKGIIPEDIPVIIVASGPSLNKNASILSKAKGKALILAVDSSVKYLTHFGVTPDFVVTVDVVKLLSHFQNPVAMNSPMFASVMASPKVLEINTGRKIFFDDKKLLKELMNIECPDANIIGAGSVATSAFELAIYLGAKKIILVGQDLAFEGNASHAMGETLQEEYSTEYSKLIEGNNGSMVRTRYDWYKYLCWFNERIAKYDGTVINATEGGAKIQGTTIMTLDEAIQVYCNKEYSSDSLFYELDKKKDNVIDSNFVRTSIEYVRKQLKDASIILDEAIDIVKRLIMENEKTLEESYRMKGFTKRLLEINSVINQRSINHLLEQFTYSTTMKEYQNLFVHFKDKQKNRENVYKKTLKVYESMKAGAEKMEAKLSEQLSHE
jgi:hypothetical protein